MTAWALFCHDFDLSKGINILSEKCPVVLDHYTSMVSQTALRVLSGNIDRPSWISSINRPDDVVTLGGKYIGPELPSGIQEAQLERDWPVTLERGK